MQDSPSFSVGDILLNDGEILKVVDIGFVREEYGGYYRDYYYNYWVKLEQSSGEVEKTHNWGHLQTKLIFDENLSVGDVVEVLVDDEIKAELDTSVRGKIVEIDKDNHLRPYKVRPINGTKDEDLTFNRWEFKKVISAASYEKKDESAKTLDKQIKKMEKKLAELDAAAVPIKEQLSALKVAREVIGFVTK